MPADPIVAFDIETSGPVPNPFSMLSLGAVCLDGETLEPRGEWYERFGPLYGPEHTFDASTREWWTRFPDQLAEALRDPTPAREAADAFVAWVSGFTRGEKGRAVLLAAPAGFDGMFVNHYAVTSGHAFDTLPWKHRIMDLASFMVGRMGIEYHRHGRFMPKVEGHDHNALNDARVLARRFVLLQSGAPPAPEDPTRGDG